MTGAAPVWTVRTEVFDGPLDLLLYLVKKDGVDLRAIRMARLADAYLEWLDAMRELHLGIAADYLVMAATLCRLKSLELLPRPPTATAVDAPEEDPREALVRRLAEHERYQRAAAELDARPRLGRDVFARDPDDAPIARPLARVDAFALLDTYYALLRRAATPDAVHEVGGTACDIGGCCREVLAILDRAGGRLDLSAVLRAFGARAERIVAFLAVLEMARLGWLDLVQHVHLGPVRCDARVRADVDLAPLLGHLAMAAG